MSRGGFKILGEGSEAVREGSGGFGRGKWGLGGGKWGLDTTLSTATIVYRETSVLLLR